LCSAAENHSFSEWPLATRNTAGLNCRQGETQAPHQTAVRPSSAQHSNVSRRLRVDQPVSTIFPLNLYARHGEAIAPMVVDIRSRADIFAMNRLFPGSTQRTPTDIEAWCRDLPRGSPVVVCDASGTAQSEEVAPTLRQFVLAPRRPAMLILSCRLSDGAP
jgi:hypothetical protein